MASPEFSYASKLIRQKKSIFSLQVAYSSKSQNVYFSTPLICNFTLFKNKQHRQWQPNLEEVWMRLVDMKLAHFSQIYLSLQLWCTPQKWCAWCLEFHLLGFSFLLPVDSKFWIVLKRKLSLLVLFIYKILWSYYKACNPININIIRRYQFESLLKIRLKIVF